MNIYNTQLGKIIFTFEEGTLMREAVAFAIREGVDLSDAHLAAANLADMDLSGAPLARIKATQTDFENCNLSGADLRGASLNYSVLRRANLSRANLAEADIHDADLSGADLTGANLVRADLRGANLSRAALHGADLSGARLTGAILSAGTLAGVDVDGVIVGTWEVRMALQLGIAARGDGKASHCAVTAWICDDKVVLFQFSDSPDTLMTEAEFSHEVWSDKWKYGPQGDALRGFLTTARCVGATVNDVKD